MENTFDTDEQLRNSLRDFEAVPDSRSFDAILEKMNKKKKRRFFMIFFFAGLIVLSASVVSFLIHFHDTEKSADIHVPHTDNDSEAHQAAGIHSIPAYSTISDPDSKQASPSSAEHASGIQTSREVKAGTTMPHREQAEIAASTGKTSPESKDKPGAPSISSDPETPGKHLSGISSAEKTNQFQASTENKPGIETVTGSLNAIETVSMPVIQIPIPVDSTQPDVRASLNEGSYPAVFYAPKHKNTYSFYIGAQASPQLNGFGLSKNPNPDPVYTTSGTNFPDVYLRTKKGQSSFNFGLPFGIKAGAQINSKYEILAGFGYQAFTEKEKLYAVKSPTISGSLPLGFTYDLADTSASHCNRFRYLTYLLEVNHFFQSDRTISFKLGLGLQGNQLIHSTYVFAESPGIYRQNLSGREKLSPWVLTAKLKAGVIFNTNKRFRFHISPGFFYSPTSIWKRNYVIRQKPYGVDIECMILFRLFSRR